MNWHYQAPDKQILALLAGCTSREEQVRALVGALSPTCGKSFARAVEAKLHELVRAQPEMLVRYALSSEAAVREAVAAVASLLPGASDMDAPLRPAIERLCQDSDPQVREKARRALLLARTVGLNEEATVRLRQGNMFDGPSDLIVLPCSTSGTITPLVAQALREFDIPSPRRGMQLGEVEFQPFTGAENIAQFVAFAASVHFGSSPKAIHRIGQQLGAFTRHEPVARDVSAPLLGSGAGGLPSGLVVENLRDGFLAEADPCATLTIHVLERKTHETLKRSLARVPAPASRAITRQSPQAGPVVEQALIARNAEHKPPRVFLSYTASSLAHAEWVKWLATYLRQNGVDARLDAWHMRAAMPMQQWMCNELQLADRVVIISDAAYAQRANDPVGGVGWETMMIHGDMARLPLHSCKYLCIVRSQQIEGCLPFYMQSRKAIHWPDHAEEGALGIELLREIFEVDLAPPIGESPFRV